jgi:hypothetical protein
MNELALWLLDAFDHPGPVQAQTVQSVHQPVRSAMAGGQLN